RQGGAVAADCAPERAPRRAGVAGDAGAEPGARVPAPDRPGATRLNATLQLFTAEGAESRRAKTEKNLIYLLLPLRLSAPSAVNIFTFHLRVFDARGLCPGAEGAAAAAARPHGGRPAAGHAAVVHPRAGAAAGRGLRAEVRRPAARQLRRSRRRAVPH